MKEGEKVYCFSSDFDKVHSGILRYYERIGTSDIWTERGDFLIKTPSEFVFKTEEEASSALSKFHSGGNHGWL